MVASSKAVTTTGKDLPAKNETESLPSLVTRLGEDVIRTVRRFEAIGLDQLKRM